MWRPGWPAGFSLHAGVAARADERKKLERLCRYISRPAVYEKRLSLTRGGNVRYQLKTPYRDGMTHVIFEPVDFIARLAALVPKPRVNLTRFHGVFAPNSKHWALVTPAKRGRGNKARVVEERPSPAERRASTTWAQRLKRVFNIDIETCSVCGGAMKVIACIEDPVVMPKAFAALAGQALKQILDHLEHKAEASEPRALPESRAPPVGLQSGLFNCRCRKPTVPISMLRSRHRGRDSQCRMSEMEPIVGSRGQAFGVAGSPSAGFGCITRLPREYTAVQNCWTWVKWAFISSMGQLGKRR